MKGKECLERADLVLYDYLANPALLDHAPSGAERIYVGRRGRGQYQDQAEINRLLIERAKAGDVVVRLKGGDPFVFGRGGEEAEAVAAAGVPFEVVPGVTAAIAVPAYAGIPVTHRTLASSLTVITGHEDPAKGTTVIDWPKLASTSGTLVFMMGMKTLPLIVSRLLEEGRSADTPVAAVRWGTRADQRTIIGTLRDIVEKTERARLEPPTVIVVGAVVKLRGAIELVREAAAFRQADRAHAGPRAGQGVRPSAGRLRRRADRGPHDQYRAARQLGGSRQGHREAAGVCLGDLHQRQWRGTVYGAARTRPPGRHERWLISGSPPSDRGQPSNSLVMD